MILSSIFTGSKIPCMHRAFSLKIIQYHIIYNNSQIFPQRSIAKDLYVVHPNSEFFPFKLLFDTTYSRMAIAL